MVFQSFASERLCWLLWETFCSFPLGLYLFHCEVLGMLGCMCDLLCGRTAEQTQLRTTVYCLLPVLFQLFCQDSETSCPSLELEICPWASGARTRVSWSWLLGEWLNTPCPKLCPTELFFPSKHFTKQNKLREKWSPVVCSSESPGFAGDLYFSFKTWVVIVGLLGFLFSVRAT